MYDWAELRHFRNLLVILERRGFRAAAESLHTSQPGLTLQAKRFQEHASIRLFQMTRTRRIQPTETGIAFMSLAKELLATRDDVIEALIAIERGEVSNLRFGCSPLVDRNLFRTFCALHKEILPSCSIRSTHADPAQLAEELVNGEVDSAIVTLPLNRPELEVEEIRKDRLVACLRIDDPLAQKPALTVTDLQRNPVVLYHPQRHPDAHELLLRRLLEAGVTIEEYCLASHPSEMEMLVKEGHGFMLIREGSPIADELTIRPIAGVNWTVDSAVVYRKQKYPKTLPVLIRKLRRYLRTEIDTTGRDKTAIPINTPQGIRESPQPLKQETFQFDFQRKGR